MSFGVDPSAGPDDAKYSTPLMLRWIARCTSDGMRSPTAAKSGKALALVGAFMQSLRLRLPMAAVWCAAASVSTAHCPAHRHGRDSAAP